MAYLPPLIIIINLIGIILVGYTEVRISESDIRLNGERLPMDTTLDFIEAVKAGHSQLIDLLQ